MTSHKTDIRRLFEIDADITFYNDLLDRGRLRKDKQLEIKDKLEQLDGEQALIIMRRE